MSEKKYSNETRKPQSIVRKIAEYCDSAINTLVGGSGVAGGFAANELRKLKKFQDKQRKLGQQAHMKRFLEKKASKYSTPNVKIPKIGGQFNKPFAAKTGPRRKIKNRLFDI